MSYSATFARTKPAYARAEATSRRGRRQWRRSRTAGVKGVDRPAGGSIQNGLCRSLISHNFLPKGDTNRRFRRTLSNKRFSGASDTTTDQRARSSCLRATVECAFGYTRACSRSPIPHSPRFAICASTLLEREDCTLVAWYRSLCAPRTGGAYDSHHRTAGIAGRAGGAAISKDLVGADENMLGLARCPATALGTNLDRHAPCRSPPSQSGVAIP